MFGFLKKDPVKKLQEQYRRKMEEATKAQRNGNIDLFSKLASEADQIDKMILSIQEKEE